MSDSYERSYYEIALTNSQVLSALAVLLLCLLGAFVAGMWVARGSVEPGTAAPSAEQARGASGGEDDGQAFQFFGDDRAAEESEPARPTAEERRISPVQVAEEEEPSPTRSPEREELPGPSPRARAGPPAEPTAGEPTEGRPERSSMVVIQVLSSSDQEQAGTVVARLKESGYRAFISPTEVEGRAMYRVRVGPYADRDQADEAAEKIKRQFRLDTWITSST